MHFRLPCVPVGDEEWVLVITTAGHDLRLCTCDLFEVIVGLGRLHVQLQFYRAVVAAEDVGVDAGIEELWA